tara:strand:- start:19578 stop:19988 length:411 start_codon:yes stop_codon:yes gene_type:complete
MLREIHPRLWISSMPTLAMLEESGADAVICCVKKGSDQEVQDALSGYVQYSIPDGVRFDTELFTIALGALIHWYEQGRTIIVHCHAGRNRSCTLAALFLIHKCGWDGGDAVDYIRKLRPRAIANPVFEERLRAGGI